MLQARATAGDVDAATRLYRDLNLCRNFAAAEQGNQVLADELLRHDPHMMQAAQLQDYRSQLEGVEAREAAMARVRALCDGVDKHMLGQMLPNLRRAALAGEGYARACYLTQGPNFDLKSFVHDSGMLDAYRSAVPGLITQGIAAGDWRIVDLLRNAHAPGSDGLAAAVLGEDPEQHYRYLKLFLLGAPGDADTLAGELSAASARLSPTQIRQADAWALRSFHQDFHGRTVDADNAPWDPCVFPYGLDDAQ